MPTDPPETAALCPWIAPRSGGYTPKATGKPKPPPPSGRGSASVSTFAEYLAKYRPNEFERERLAAMTPEERSRDGFQRAMRDLHCRHCGALPDADGDHSCPCPYSDGECPNHAV